eukprot:408618-Rhodomonas_salina.1
MRPDPPPAAKSIRRSRTISQPTLSWASAAVFSGLLENGHKVRLVYTARQRSVVLVLLLEHTKRATKNSLRPRKPGDGTQQDTVTLLEVFGLIGLSPPESDEVS